MRQTHKNRNKKKAGGFNRVIGLAGMIVSGVLIVFGAVLLARNQIAYAAGDASYDALREQIQTLEYEESMEQVQSALASAEEADTQTADEQTVETVSASGDEAAADAAQAERFASLSETNPDVCAWIWQDGTCIDYPVVIGEDNEYYLHHLFSGKTNALGCIFVDYRNSGDFSDQNTVIYGHNMKNGSMFHSITDYKDPEVYETRPAMTIYTPEKTYTLELFAGVVESGDEAFFRFNFESDEDFMEYVDELKANSTFTSDIEVEPGDRLVTLCTCSYEFDNARYALVGRLVG